ncbi:hypothetical protein [Ilumatobacter sp.]|uniref:hypothetical protein n=1 Tax=Ilumatobacter sp. TaxID=1967498 RepID=UPI0037531918
MTGLLICEELSAMWERLSTSTDLSVDDALSGLVDHCVRHGCDENNVHSVLIDVCLKATDDPEVIVGMSHRIEEHGDRHVAWRSVLLGSLGSVVGGAADRGAAGPVVARREYHRLRRLWSMPVDARRWETRSARTGI